MESQEIQKQTQLQVKQLGNTQKNQMDSLLIERNIEIRDSSMLTTKSTCEESFINQAHSGDKAKKEEINSIEVSLPQKMSISQKQVSQVKLSKQTNLNSQSKKQIEQKSKINSLNTKTQNKNRDAFGLYKFSLNNPLNMNIKQPIKRYEKINQYLALLQYYKNEFAKQKSQQNDKQIQDKLKKANIRIIKGDYDFERRMQTLWRLRLVKDYKDFKRVTYSLNVSKFQIDVNIFIINGNDNLNKQDAFKSGGFGQVFLITQINNSQKRKVCLKRIRFQHRDQTPMTQIQKNKEIQENIKQVGICKLLGENKIGPKHLSFSIDGFEADIIVFNNSIVYKMQKGESINSKLNQQYIRNGSNTNGLQAIKKLAKQLKADIGKQIAQLHLMKMVHRDIKPANIIYDTTLNKFVLVDFGLSHSLSEKMNQQSNPFHYVGTPGYMLDSLLEYCKQQNYQKSNKKVFNLYYNDYKAFTQTIKLIFEKIDKIEQENKIKQEFQTQLLYEWSLPIQNYYKQSLLQKTSRELNFMRLVFNFRLQIAWKWIQKINLIENEKKKEQQKTSLQEYFMIENIIGNNFNDKMKKINIFENQQGRNSLAQHGLISMNVTFDYFIMEKKQEFLDKIKAKDQQFNKVNKTQNQLSEFTFKIMQFIVDLNILAAKNKSCDWVLQTNQPYIQHFINKLQMHDLKEGNIKCVYYNIMGLFFSRQKRNDPHNLVLVEQVVRYFKRQFPTLQLYQKRQLSMSLIKLCDQFATTRLACSLIPKLVDISLDVRQFYHKYNDDSTINIIISACLNMIQDKKQFKINSVQHALSFVHKNYDWKEMDRLLTVAENLLINIYGQNQKKTRLYTKINFVKGIHYTNLGQWKQAETYSLQTLKMAQYHFGQESDFYICTLFNLANIYDKIKMNEKNQQKIQQYFNKGISYMQLALQHYSEDINIFSIYENIQQVIKKMKMSDPQMITDQIFDEMKSAISLHKNAPIDWKKQLIKTLKQYKSSFFKVQNIQNWKVSYINAFYMLQDVIKMINYIPSELERTAISINSLLLTYQHLQYCCINEECQGQKQCCRYPHKSDYYYYKIMIQNKRQSEGMKKFKNLWNDFMIYDAHMQEQQNQLLRNLNLCPAFPECQGKIQDLCQSFTHYSEQQIQYLEKYFPSLTRQQIFRLFHK